MLYEDSSRGTIQYEEHAKQIVLFEGLRYKNITPTDVDCIVEIKDTGYIICEFKYGGSKVPYGQYLCLTRICDDFEKAGKTAVLLVCEHDCDAGRNIMAKDTVIREMYYKHKIYNKYNGMTLKEVWDKVSDNIYSEWEKENVPEWIRDLLNESA